jgi:hypothetical protein
VSTISGIADAMLRACALTRFYLRHDNESFGHLLGDAVADPADAAHLIVAFLTLVKRIAEEYDLDLEEWLTAALPALAVVAAEEQDQGPRTLH